jgi:hypothetical protein
MAGKTIRLVAGKAGMTIERATYCVHYMHLQAEKPVLSGFCKNFTSDL